MFYIPTYYSLVLFSKGKVRHLSNANGGEMREWMIVVHENKGGK